MEGGKKKREEKKRRVVRKKRVKPPTLSDGYSCQNSEPWFLNFLKTILLLFF